MTTEKRHGVEEVNYLVIKTYDNFEIRKYDAVTIVSADTNKIVGSEGFSSLFNYISGKNKAAKEIPMTAPVLNKVSNRDPSIAFVMPKSMILESIPEPLKENLTIEQLPAGYYAGMKFTGFNNKGKIEQKIVVFRELLNNNGYEILSDFYLARFDPPFTLPPLRKNELLVRIDYKE